MTVTYLIGQSEIIRHGDGALVHLGATLGPVTNARAILSDLTGVDVSGPEVVEAFATEILQPLLIGKTKYDVVEVHEHDIDEWAKGRGLTLGKRGVRGL